ncbi:MAG: Por secretion system protein, partial [Prevotella sp.]|nr:Por secretion system protein [Prevotella sp.]
MKKLTNLLVFLSLNAGLFAQTPVWKNYLSYQQKQEIAQAHRNLLYVLASQGLYAYHPDDRSIRTFDKVNGLADAAIAHISYNTSAHRLVVVYVNGNIDLLDDDGQVTHLSAYRDAQLTADKTVNSICQHGNDAFLATGFGIVRLNVARAEVSDTYNLSLPVAYCWVEQQLLKAASPTAGMLQCPLNSNLADPFSWQHTGAFVAQTPVDN